VLVITNLELDHTDYFPDLEALQESFRKAVRSVPESGSIVTDPKEPNIAAVLDGAKAQIVDYTKEDVPVIRLVGEFNRANARAAKAAAKAAFPDISEKHIDEALEAFQGSWRRFEYRGETPKGAQVYDDYAHHPTAIARTIEAARERFPEKRIVVAFQPHLYSRTRSFLTQFAEVLALADYCLVAPIYAARETPDTSVSNHSIVDSIKLLAPGRRGDAAAMDTLDEIRDELLQESEGSVIITMGAGDIYKVAEQIAD